MSDVMFYHFMSTISKFFFCNSFFLIVNGLPKYMLLYFIL